MERSRPDEGDGEPRTGVCFVMPIRRPRISVRLAVAADIPSIVTVRIAAAEDLTARFGGGHWSGHASERGVAWDLRQGKVLVASRGRSIVGTLKIGTRKPWAIDPSYFTKARRPWYLTNMAVHPKQQRLGIGSALVRECVRLVGVWGGDAVWLDAYDDPQVGAGPFYQKCGFREVGRKTYRVTPLVYYELSVAG